MCHFANALFTGNLDHLLPFIHFTLSLLFRIPSHLSPLPQPSTVRFLPLQSSLTAFQCMESDLHRTLQFFSLHLQRLHHLHAVLLLRQDQFVRLLLNVFDNLLNAIGNRCHDGLVRLTRSTRDHGLINGFDGIANLSLQFLIHLRLHRIHLDFVLRQVLAIRRMPTIQFETQFVGLFGCVLDRHLDLVAVQIERRYVILQILHLVVQLLRRELGLEFVDGIAVCGGFCCCCC
mmetsp:Transcript_21347/g.60979  ORF Transcript_21347/g.60979 Transcript_21347/m.60979 type:complete len:232 (-) Transcript_21347:540-1235(-)